MERVLVFGKILVVECTFLQTNGNIVLIMDFESVDYILGEFSSHQLYSMVADFPTSAMVKVAVFKWNHAYTPKTETNDVGMPCFDIMKRGICDSYSTDTQWPGHL